MDVDHELFFAFCEAKFRRLENWKNLDGFSFDLYHPNVGYIEVLVNSLGLILGVKKTRETDVYQFIKRSNNTRYLYHCLGIPGKNIEWTFQCENSTHLKIYYNPTLNEFDYSVVYNFYS